MFAEWMTEQKELAIEELQTNQERIQNKLRKNTRLKRPEFYVCHWLSLVEEKARIRMKKEFEEKENSWKEVEEKAQIKMEKEIAEKDKRIKELEEKEARLKEKLNRKSRLVNVMGVGVGVLMAGVCATYNYLK